MDFQRLELKTAQDLALTSGNYSVSLGDSPDYFAPGNSFELEGYLFLPDNPKALIVFQSDIFSLGSDEFAVKLGESLKARGVAVLTFDNSGTKFLGGKSGGEVRDYLPEQMQRDLQHVVEFIKLVPQFTDLLTFISGFSYGNVPVTLTTGLVSNFVDGVILLSPPESGKDFYEKYLKEKMKEERVEGSDKFVNYDINGKTITLSELFFSKKRMMMNGLFVIETVYDILNMLTIPVRLIYAGSDEILGKPNVNGKEPFIVIPDANHNFSNKWEEMISTIVDFMA